MSYEFIGDMVNTVGYHYSFSFLFGSLRELVTQYLRGDITRAKFTAEFACMELANTRYRQLLDETEDDQRAMRRLMKELKVVTEPLPQALGDSVAPS